MPSPSFLYRPRCAWRHTLSPTFVCAVLLAAVAGPAQAAEGFKLRFPLSGTLGGEMAGRADQPGFFGSLVSTQIELDKVTDDSGQPRQIVRSGAFATPAPVAGVVRTARYSGTVNTDFRQSQTNANLVLGYLTEAQLGGGRWSFVVNLPYTTRLDRRLRLSGSTPTLTPLSPTLSSPPLPAGVPAAAQAAAQSGFDTAYQAQLGAQSAAGSGVVDGLGDAEFTAAWVRQGDELRVAAGATLALPTGRYDAAQAINIGFGNFYTLRPTVAVAWQASEAWTLAARGSLGLNTRNRDNDWRSGDFAALDLAAACRSAYGVWGPHLILVRQYRDDDGGTQGANRFSATGAGAFFTTRVPSAGLALNLSWMRMVSAKNALSGSFYQLRASRAF